MTFEQQMEDLKLRLKKAIESHEIYLKSKVDTGTMWRLSAYKEILDVIEGYKLTDA